VVKTVTVGSASAAPGEKATGFLKAAEFNDGSPINVPVIVVNGSKEGPSLWIECCIHGNEVAGPYALLKTIQGLDPKNMNGTLIGVPALNITAFWTNGRIPIFDTKDLNRIMPGDPDGSFAEQYASAIYKAVKANADHLVDVHWAGKVDWALYNAEVKIAEKCSQLAKASAFEVIVSDGHGGILNGALFNVVAREGISSVILESKDRQKIHVAYTNILKHLGMIDGRPVEAKSQKMYKGFAWREVVIKRGGLFHPKIEEGEEVSKGDVLGVVTNIFGEEVAKVTCPVNGLVMLAPGHEPVKTGDTPFEIAIEA